MAKVCDMQDCNEEIADWQNYCPKHYAQVQQQKQESAIQQPEAQQPVQPAQQPVQGTGTPETEQEPQMIDVEEKQPVTDQKQKIPMPRLEQRERLIIKQVAMKSAVEFLQQTPVEYNDYGEMIGQLRRLVVDMYRIIVEENEQSTTT